MLLPTPTEDNSVTKEYTEVAAVNDGEYNLISRRKQIDQRIGPFCAQLGYAQGLVGGFIKTFSQGIAHKIRRTKFHGCRSPQPIIAVSIQMASHILCVATSVKRNSEVVGVSERTIRTAYRSVYLRRAELTGPRSFHSVSRVKLPKGSSAASSCLIQESTTLWGVHRNFGLS